MKLDCIFNYYCYQYYYYYHRFLFYFLHFLHCVVNVLTYYLAYYSNVYYLYYLMYYCDVYYLPIVSRFGLKASAKCLNCKL